MATAVTIEMLHAWLNANEAERLEFKAARNQYSSEKLRHYCAALANEGGGHLVLGVSDSRPRQVEGTAAFPNLADITKQLLDAIRLRIECAEFFYENHRVIVFTVPSRPLGYPVKVDGMYLMRSGESLVSMTEDHLKGIFAEAQPDFSSQTIRDAQIDDLDPAAVLRFQALWSMRQPAAAMKLAPQMLEDAGLLRNGEVTSAALVLLGNGKALDRYLPQAEVIFEFREQPSSISFDWREEFRAGFLLVDDSLWECVARRNKIYPIVTKFFRRDIPAVNERSFREAVLNAISHRDYRLQGSVFIRQSPNDIEIDSPGGFPEGITAENILFRQSPRNRLLSEALGKCGLVERSGQGADLMFEASVREGKALPDYSDSDSFHVQLRLSGAVRDEAAVRVIQQITDDVGRPLSTGELLVINAVVRVKELPLPLHDMAVRMTELGILERAAKKRLVLAHKYARLHGSAGIQTRRRGLDRNTNKELLLQHLRKHAGAQLIELCSVLPNLTDRQVQALLRELKAAGQIRVEGRTKSARWFLVG